MGYDVSESQTIIPNQTKTHLKAIFESELVKLQFAVDPSLNLGLTARNLYQMDIKDMGTELTGHEFIDLAVIAVPSRLHLEVTTMALQVLKPNLLLIEKPMGCCTSCANQIIEATTDANCLVLVNYFRRYLPGHQEALARLRSIITGDVEAITVSAYGSLRNIFSHFLDLITFYTSIDFSQVKVQCDEKILQGLIYTLEFNGRHFQMLLLGVNAAKTSEPRLEIVYSEFILEITNNGQLIELKNRTTGNTFLQVNCPQNEFNRYQTFVLNQIASNWNSSKSEDALKSALGIHILIDGLESAI
jgi:predicted dehydrogenase